MLLVSLTLIITSMIFQVKSQNLPVSDQLETTSGNVELRFIGHGSLMFRMNEIIIYIDPVKTSGNYDNLPKADIILVTHEHYDHLDNDLIGLLKKSQTVILCNQAAAAKVAGARALKAGDTQSIGNVIIEAVAAYNIVNERAPGQPFHPKGSGLGYIITFGGKRIYVAGDTENTPEMKALKNIDVAFLPMNLPYTMTPEMVADAAKAFKPGILYPYHYGDTNTDEIIKLLKNSGIEVRIRNLK
ncbi:MAG: MBL fold metallo-hydrolase [Bacteroidales bacterium]|nr:MBL fold metallo-hydrolase [Bacteroidales bacterium]